MSNYNPLNNPKDTVHTIQRMIDDAAQPPLIRNNSTGIASGSGSGGVASELPIFDSLWSSYEEAIDNGNVGWLRGYSLTPEMSAVIGGGETLADAIFGFDVPNKILHLGNATNQGVELRIYEPGGGGYMGFIADAASNNKLFTLPNDWPASTKFLQVSAGGLMSYASGSGGGAIVFTDLADVPTSYASAALNLVRVNAAATGLEFITNPWKRTVPLNGLIEFQTANDQLQLDRTISGVVASFNNTTGSNACVLGDHSASAGVGIEGHCNHATGLTRAVLGIISSSSNQAYAGFFQNDSYIDHSSLYVTGGIDLGFASSNVTPASNRTSLYCQASDGRLYYILPSGVIYGPLDSGTGSSNVANFTDLLDVPSSYSGSPADLVRVNATNDGLEFWTPTFTNYWSRSGTDLIPVTADDNILLHDGSTFGWGDGNPGTLDIWMGRGAAGRIDVGDNSTSYLFRVWGGASTNYTQMAGSFRSVQTLSTDTAFQSLISTDTNARLLIDASGHYGIGAGGAGTIDTGFGRTGANLLAMDTGDSFQSDTFIITNAGHIQTEQGVGNNLAIRGYATTGAVWQDLIKITNGALAALLDFPQGFTWANGLIPITAGGTGQGTATAAINALGAKPCDVPFMQYIAKTTATATVLVSNSTYCMYLGKAPKNFTTMNVCFLNGASGGAITWAELALASGGAPVPANNMTLTLRGTAANIAAVVNTNGAKNVAITATFAAGEHMWLLWGTQASATIMLPRPCFSDEEDAGLLGVATATRPSTMAANTVFSKTISRTGFFGYYYPS